MIRDLTYAIQFATANELTLVHGMTLDEDSSDGRHETFSIEGRGVHGASFTPPQFFLLHEAIHEMLRMAEQHRDALTDGAGVGAVAKLSAGELDVLRSMANDDATIPAGHWAFRLLFNRGMLVAQSKDGPLNLQRPYVLSDAGRRVLAEADDAPRSGNAAQILAILVALRDGEHMNDQGELFPEMHRRELIALVSGGYYTITDAGRAYLAEHSDG